MEPNNRLDRPKEGRTRPGRSRVMIARVDVAFLYGGPSHFPVDFTAFLGRSWPSIPGGCLFRLGSWWRNAATRSSVTRVWHKSLA